MTTLGEHQAGEEPWAMSVETNLLSSIDHMNQYISTHSLPLSPLHLKGIT